MHYAGSMSLYDCVVRGLGPRLEDSGCEALVIQELLFQGDMLGYILISLHPKKLTIHRWLFGCGACLASMRSCPSLSLSLSLLLLSVSRGLGASVYKHAMYVCICICICICIYMHAHLYIYIYIYIYACTLLYK